jgi:hypothetical protein
LTKDGLDLLAQRRDIRDQAVEGLGLKAPLKLGDSRVQLDQFPLGVDRRALRLGRADGTVRSRRQLAESGAEAGRIVADIAVRLAAMLWAERPPEGFRACGNHWALLAHSGSVSLSMLVRVVTGDSSRVLNP